MVRKENRTSATPTRQNMSSDNNTGETTMRTNIAFMIAVVFSVAVQAQEKTQIKIISPLFLDISK